jgi:hypothetical protein
LTLRTEGGVARADEIIVAGSSAIRMILKGESMDSEVSRDANFFERG